MIAIDMDGRVYGERLDRVLTTAIRERGLTWDALAHRIGTTRQRMARWRLGESAPTILELYTPPVEVTPQEQAILDAIPPRGGRWEPIARAAGARVPFVHSPCTGRRAGGMKLRLAIVAALAGVLAFNGAAAIYAAATAPTITACVKSSGAQKGLMRYAPAGKCASGETKLVWNGPGTWPQPPASPTADSFGPGTWRVGAEIQPGTYRALGDGVTNLCFWERLSGFGGTLAEVIENGNPTPPAIVTIAATDVGFSSERCGVWTRVR